MPTYEFRCPNGHDFDRFFKTMSSAPAELPCPQCGAVANRQLSAGAGFLFKGSGFYQTDYGKNAHRKREAANTDSGESKGDSKGESKSEGTKSEAPKTEGTKPRTEGREPRTEGREPRTEGREPKAEGRERKAENSKSSKTPKPKSE